MAQRGVILNISLAEVLGLALMIQIISSTSLTVSLIPMKTFCFNEDLPKHTLVQFDVSSGGHPYRIQIMYLRDVMYNISATQKTSKSITTQKFGIYRFCITNEAQFHNNLIFEFLTGVHAKDYSSHTQSTDYIGSLENQARIAQLFINQIQQQNRAGLQIMSENNLKYSKYSIQYFFTVIFIGMIMILSYAQFVIIRNHMINRKYI